MVNGWSGIEIPEKGVDYHSIKPTPHGLVSQSQYYSDIRKMAQISFIPLQNMTRVLPRSIRYSTCNTVWVKTETSWANQGKMNFIMDNLIAEGKTPNL